ncbi:GTP 3'8-cyclase [Dissostichus eleginoides]|uniref:GTP 3'8-cyclase n=1 Tax=Dissostichus eleginoides TaxID=100907 RepID=A0AAD9EXN9_DISEL|nr:GTP 3'8-cyclase [Dissostichus eleginoides]
MAQPTARHEGDQGGGERTAVSQTPCQAAASAQPRSMPAPFTQRGVADHPKDAEEMTRSEHGKEVEFFRVSFIDRCPLLPNGGRHLFIPRLLSSSLL